jgi:hypothetical protein
MADRKLSRHETHVWQEATKIAGENWMRQPNAHFGLLTPAEMVRRGKGRHVRSLLLTMRHISFS